jgi:hypothetical protein
MSDDTHTILDDGNSSVIESPEIFSPLFANGDVEEIRKAARSPVYKLLQKLVEERLAAAAPAAK